MTPEQSEKQNTSRQLDVAAGEYVEISLHLNGQTTSLKVQPWVTLLDALREHIGLTGTKKGCDHGQCGACTVLVNGKRINSCLSLAIMNNGQEITTIEGLSHGDSLHPMQAAFIEMDAFQCGYCTPGQICSAVGLINEGNAHTITEIRDLMSGNICRCGAYPNINAAILQVMTENGKGGPI
jgi:xanthine dehydrogenase YagT iron-sulfur-binding subunit